MYTKEQSSVSKFRNYMTMFRNDISYSEHYKLHEDVFLKIASGDGNNMKETIYHMDNVEKKLLDNFMFSRASGLLFNKCNINPKTGKATIVDPKSPVLGSCIVICIIKFI